MIDVEKTKLDKKKVSEISKDFDLKKILPLPTNDFRKEREERIKNRIVEQIVGAYGAAAMDMALAGDKPEQIVQYWDSYEDHIKKYEIKIEDIKAEILYQIEVLKNLEKARKDIIKEKATFDNIKFEPRYWPMKNCDDKELDKTIHDIVKAHEIRYHMNWLYNCAREFDPNIDDCKKATEQPNYEMICGNNGKLKYIRCIDCYRQRLLGNEKYKNYNDMNIYNKPGSKY